MKICYIYREKERKAHSIELLFNTISKEVSKREGFEIQKWYKPVSDLKAIRQVRMLNADIYHITGDCYFLSLFLPWRKTIMTIHDIGMYKNHPKTVKRIIFVLLSFILPMKVLRLSTTISHLTQEDLVNMLGINKKKLAVVPNPLVLDVEYSPKKFNCAKPTILQIGTGQHKNLIGLIEAVKGIPCFLDIVGNPDKLLIEKMIDYGIDYNISFKISNAQIIEKYINCDILYFASLSEGFGLPILEAQTVGRALITSDTQPTKWVCGDGGLLVNPKSVEEIRASIMKLINEADLRDDLIKKGRLNARRFDLQTIVDEYIDIYKKVSN
jgi:glycosyltransferase involved in cell wall biosynthesis